MKTKMPRQLVAILAAAVSATTLFAADTFPSWVKDVRQERKWQTGKLASYEKTYSARIAQNPSDYEARVLHAATIVAGVVESNEAKAFLTQFGYTLNFPGLKPTRKRKPMAQWPKPNDVADTFVKKFVPPLKGALEDLEAIPEDWDGSVRLLADEYGFDEDVEVDCGDVLYAKSSLKSLVGGAYFVQGNDIVTDWKKISNIFETTGGRKVPILYGEPGDDPYELLWDEGFWHETLRMRAKELEPEHDGAEQSVAFVGNRLYIRTVAPYNAIGPGGEENYEEALEDPPSVYLQFYNDSAKKWAFLAFRKVWRQDDEGEWTCEYVFSAESNLDNKTYYNTGNWASDLALLALPCDYAVEVDASGRKTSVYVVDFTERKALVKATYWEVDSAWTGVWKYGTQRWWGPNEEGYWDDELGEWVYLYGEWVEDDETGEWHWDGEYSWQEYEGWNETSFEFDAGRDEDSFTMEALTKSGAYSLKVRNAATLQTAKEYFRGALRDARLADERVLSREDEAMHFVEYDSLEREYCNEETGEYDYYDPMPDLRRATGYALAALDEATEVDFNGFSPIPLRLIGGKSGSFRLATLIPNGGVTEMFIGALFSGKLTHSAIPQVSTDIEYGDPNIVFESVSDPTVAGLFPQFNAWDFLHVAEGFGFGYVHAPVAIALDAAGGTVAKAKTAKTTASYDDEEGRFMIGVLPTPDARNGYLFNGWWTCTSGGEQVRSYDLFDDLSFFGNPKAPTLYAQWRKACKITVSGGFLDDGATTRSGLYSGEEVSAEIDWSKLYDKNENDVNAFANWTYTPATEDLGEGFDPLSPEISVTMPNADVKLTANFVNGFAGYLYCSYYIEGTDAQGNEPEGDFYWSIDNGKTLFPFNGREYPVKSGKVTVKFYDKTGKWRASDQTFTVNKRGTYKEDGVTRYSDPETIFPLAKFVPVDNSTKVKMDANGGTGAGDVFFANGCEYGWLGIPYRKGYVFAGWWTAKDGGEHITQDKMFDPADFVGQKTPTIYAHWLQFRKLTMKDDSAHAYWDLEDADIDPELLDEITQSLYATYPDFDGYRELAGKGTLEVLPGARVMVLAEEYTYDARQNEFIFQKWTVTPSKAYLGPNFMYTNCEADFIMPDEDITLQGTYIDGSACAFLTCRMNYETSWLGYDEEKEEYVYLRPPAGSIEWSVDNGKSWYKAYMHDTSYYGDEDSDFVGDYAMLKPGAYTVTWRSANPQWAVPTTKDKVVLAPLDDFLYESSGVSFIPQVVVDVVAYDRETSDYIAEPTAGAVTLSPKEGLVPAGKTITLTAKASKDYVFQGYLFKKGWDGSSLNFYQAAATWKLANYASYCCGLSTPSSYLTQYIDPVDMKVHVVAIFKALSDYSADDIVFNGFEGWDSFAEASYDGDGNASVTIKAVVGCALDDDYALVCDSLASPLAYKLNGKLPDGLKFDAKTGILSGAPKKAGKTMVTIVAMDPAKNSKSLTVNFDIAPLPLWLVGEYRGAMSDTNYTPGYWDEDEQTWVGKESLPGQQEGVLELSVKSDGKVSAKLLTSVGSRSVSGTLSWFPDEDDAESEGTFTFTAKMTKDDEECDVEFYPDGTISGYADSYSKSEDTYLGGKVEGMRQDDELLAQSPFLDKYYTFAFCATNSVSVYDDGGYAYINESEARSGYGYLTIKTDKKGAAKATGQLPDGEKVSMSALVLPFVDEDESLKARLYVFASPSSYKKQDWFAMSLVIGEDGTVTSEDGAAWTPADVDPSKLQNYYGDYGYDKFTAHVFGDGSLYSEAKTLENYYWIVSCEWNEAVLLQYKGTAGSCVFCGGGDTGGGGGAHGGGGTVYEVAYALDFGGFFFNVMVKGDSKGAISLVGKSPAPWVEDGAWNCWKDKKDNVITDPSQLSISFTKATGIFSGKASVYFDYPKPTSASLPYTGVMIYDGDGGYVGFGSAVYSYKYSYYDSGKAKTDTKKVTLPLTLEPAE